MPLAVEIVATSQAISIDVGHVIFFSYQTGEMP